MPAEAIIVRTQARRTVAEWRNDQEAAIEIEARLERGGFDAIDINAEVFVQARELFDMFDQLMIAAQRRRIGLLREISIRQRQNVLLIKALAKPDLGTAVRLKPGQMG
jgi:hypothetical protein